MMRKLYLAASTAAFFVGMMLCAADSATAITFAQGCKPVNDPDRPGQPCFEITAPGKYLLSSELIEVDPGSNYRLRGFFRSGAGTPGATDFGLFMYDAGKQPIEPSMVNVLRNSATSLTAPAVKGSTTIQVANASRWLRNPKIMTVVAFHAKPDYSDLPNRNLGFYVKSISGGSDQWTVTLSKPLSQDYPAGTLLRQQVWSDGSANAGFNREKLPETWREYAGIIDGQAVSGVPVRQFWPGTRYVRVCLYASPGAPVRFSGIEFAKVMRGERFPLDYSGAALKESWRPFQYSEQFSNPDGLSARVPYYGGFASPKMDWDAANIRQIEVECSATEGGFWQLNFSGNYNGKKVNGFLEATAPADGRLHTIIFDVSSVAAWKGRITSISLYRACIIPSRITLTRVRALPERNLLPAAEKIAACPTSPVDYLRPRGEYTLSWENGINPGMTLECLDRDSRTIQRVELPSGRHKTTFTAPELTVNGRLKINKKTAGTPRLVLDKLTALHLPPTYWKGSWIWCHPGPGPELTNVWFQRDFDLVEPIGDASLAIVGDDVCHVYVNDRQLPIVGTGAKASRVNIQKYLKPGRNTVKVRIYNGISWGGMLCDLYIRSGGKDVYVSSGKDWRCRIASAQMPERIDDPVSVIGPAGVEPWISLDYSYVGPRGEIEVARTEPGRFSARVLCPPVIRPDKIKVRVKTPEDPSGKDFSIAVPGDIVWKKDAVFTIDYRLPPAPSGSKVFCDDDYLAVRDNVPLGSPPVQTAGVPPLASAKIVDIGTRPSILIDGKKYSPILWGLINPFRKNPVDKAWMIDDARFAGIPLLIVGVSFSENYAMPGFYRAPDTFDFSAFDHRMDIVLNSNPDARVMLQIFCFMPDWWLKANPDDVVTYFGNAPRTPNMDKQALASKKWLADCRKPLHALIEHIKKSPYADRIFAASLSESINSEWIWNKIPRSGQYTPAGYSPGDLSTFRGYLREKYKTDDALTAAWAMPGATLGSASMLTPEEQNFPGRLGVLLDPKLDARLMDWYDFRNRAIGEAVIELCRIVKEETSNHWLVGAYYGYFTEFAAGGASSLQTRGHNYFLEVAKSPYVDFVRAPTRYDQRQPGFADGIMQLEDTYTLRKKLVYIEQDFRSWTGSCQGIYGSTSTVAESISNLNRAFGMMLAQGVSHYWIDFGQWMEEKVLLDLVRKQDEIYAGLPPVRGLTPREVCLVHDGRSAYYIRSIGDGLFTAAVRPLMMTFNENAMPYYNLTIPDLLQEGLVPPCKFYIVTSALVLSREERERLMARFEREKATVLWLYAPGVFYPGQSPKAANVADFLGISCRLDEAKGQPTMKLDPGLGVASAQNYNSIAPWFYPVGGYEKVLGRNAADGRPMLVVKKIGSSTHYFSTLPSLPNPVIRRMAAGAGVHIYSSTSDPMWIGNDVVFLIAKTGGEKSISLPSGTKIRAILGPLEGTFVSGQSWSAVTGQTYGFLVEK